jgi:CRISPR-associated endonuclease Cas1
MAAGDKLPQVENLSKSHINRSGVLTIHGFGVSVRVQSGHLEIEDGICDERRKFRLPRVGHGLKRLCCIGSDGFISFAAMRWLADQDAAFIMLERNGKVLAVTGPVRPSDARLRRAQAMAEQSGAALQISRELISKKLAGQELVARRKLLDPSIAQNIARCRAALANAQTIAAVRQLEAEAAAAYWSAWYHLPITFPKKDLPRVPEHWRTFGNRKSPISGSPRLAANPANAILNFLYAVLESEARLAAAALGLDPGLGFLHVDTPARDSLACDLMEPVRPLIDGYLVDWITREPLRREWLFEQTSGNCRLMGSFAARLSETAPLWGCAVAPYAEWVAQTLWTRRRGSDAGPATRLTHQRRRAAKGHSAPQIIPPAPRLQHLCAGCGKPIRPERTHCAQCAVTPATERLPILSWAAEGSAIDRRRSANRGSPRRLSHSGATARCTSAGSRCAIA